MSIRDSRLMFGYKYPKKDLNMAFLDFLVEQELNELVVRGNRSTKDKIKKKRLNRMKRLKKCSGNMTPSVTTVNGVQKVTCTPKDRKRARMMKRVSSEKMLR